MFDLIIRDFNDPRVISLKGDLTKQEQIEGALNLHSIQAVVHTASPDPNSIDSALHEAVNVRGTSNVIAACNTCGVQALVYTSTASVVWAESAQQGLDEVTATYPAVFRDSYARTKAEAEQIVMDAGAAGREGRGLITISLRPHAIWGHRDQMVATTIEVAKAGKTRFIVGDGTNVVDWTFVGNVVHAHLLALQASFLCQTLNLRATTDFLEY